MDKGLIAGSTTLLVLKLLEHKDMYGYQMIEELAKKSDQTFHLKAGTLYPILHGLEQNGMVTSYDEQADGGRLRKYYRLTSKGKGQLADKKQEWMKYAQAVQNILNEGATYAVH